VQISSALTEMGVQCFQLWNVSYFFAVSCIKVKLRIIESFMFEKTFQIKSNH